MRIQKLSTALIVTLCMSMAACGQKEASPPSNDVQSPPTTGDIICSYAPSQSSVVASVSAAAGGSAVAAAGVTQAAGLTAVIHSSGAYIFTGAGGYLAGTIGTAIVAPVLVGVGVVVGGTAVTIELLCAPKNHPVFSEKVMAAAKEFYERSKRFVTRDDAPATTSESIVVEIDKSPIKTGDEAVEFANREAVEAVEPL
jgi:predicted small lipoprotein YifL